MISADHKSCQVCDRYFTCARSEAVSICSGFKMFNPLISSSDNDSSTSNELSPDGKSQHEPGAKMDKDKVMAGLLFKDMPRALWKVAEVLTYGAKKYTEHGWKFVENGESRYFDAMCRHMLKDSASNDGIDVESGLSHKAHRLCNDLMEFELELVRSGFKME